MDYQYDWLSDCILALSTGATLVFSLTGLYTAKKKSNLLD